MMQRAADWRSEPRVFMMDLWATVPYYTAYLSRALQRAGVPVQIGSITYYLDRDCFRSRRLRLEPGLLDIVGRLRLPRIARRVLKLAEGAVNLTALRFRFLLRAPDIIHVQFLPLLRSRFPMDRWFLRFCRKRGARLVLTVHDLLPHDTGEAHRALYASLYADMDALICHSAHIQTRLRDEFGVPEAKVSVIPHGPFFYDLPASGEDTALASLGVPSGSTMVLWQGIIFPYKGVDLLLKAWRQVEDAGESMTLVVLGTGDPALLAALEQQARRLQLERVNFHFRFCSAEELVAAYRAATVVVYPYRAITTSGAIATGLALGKPIVASNLPVFQELLTDGETALLVDPKDSAQLANALLRVANEPELRGELSRNVKAMRFGDEEWGKIGEKTLCVYERVLPRSGVDAGAIASEKGTVLPQAGDGVVRSARL